MASRKARRRGRSQTILPFHASSAPNVVSCWYCDAKIYAFNDVLLSVGFRHSRFLKMWFNVGVAFSVLTLVGVSAGENCMTPVQIRGMSWVEVSYLSPYSSGCLKYRRHSSEDTHQSCCFRISASLALVNSLPVYFLDGEAILETFFCYFTFINRRHRRKVLQCCLVGGSILSVISFSRIVYSAVVPE